MLAELLVQLERDGFVTAIASISLPNRASVALHEQLGFTLAGTIRAPGHKLGEWIDIGYFQRDLAPRETPPREPGT